MLPTDKTKYEVLTHKELALDEFLCLHPDTCSEIYLRNPDTGCVDYVISETVADYAYDVNDDDEAAAFIFDLHQDLSQMKSLQVLPAYYIPQLTNSVEHYIELAQLYQDEQIPMAVKPEIYRRLKTH